MRIPTLRVILAGIALWLVVLSPAFGAGQAQGAAEWPRRPIEIVVGWSAGGTSDITVRSLAREMSEYLDVEIRITNMEGANGGIAFTNVADGAADGYRWFGGAQVQATYPITQQSRHGWEVMFPFPAGMGATTIYVRSDSGFESVTDLVDWIKAQPGTVNFGTTSRGGNGSIFAAAFADAAGISDRVVEIPYDGGREAGRFLVAGEVPFISVSMGDVADWAEAGTIKPVLNLYHEDVTWRGVNFPAVGRYFPQLEIYTAINPYWGIAVPRETPEPVMERIVSAFNHAVQQERFKSALDERGILVAPLTGNRADEAAALVGAGRGWAQYDLDIVDISPARFQIPRLGAWQFPYNDSSRNVRPWPAAAR